jgi:putative ABC transport system permease protein
MRFPAVVLGATAAQHLGVTAIGTDVRIGDQWCAVLGVLNPIPLAPGIDSSALIGWHAALSYFAFSGHPTTVYARVDQDQLNAVEAIIPRSVSPTTPQSVAVATPSDAIAARVAATSALSSLLIGLAGVALLIGGLGIANTMVVSVLERRSEIGLRRSLGATRAQIRHQFLAESLLLSIMGGVSGTVVGIVVTSAYASERGWPTSVPIWASVGGLVVTAVIGACAGLYPAIRASRVSPTEALTAG